ncbi:potassium channel family protein [Vibrio sp. TH_r3]|uniref:potassium channel protein n=1 Tax=Vibrio sp. TH_r3 TaxID=3082084 RepID=UPI002953E254|nr:potassium channel family protein [Vibrio sp. TH_r3]MDV7105329.1 potassium channel family protein [Vibrio sp. TH_r3]
MSLWLVLRQWTVRHLGQLTGRNLFFLLFGYILISWILLHFAGELDLTHSLSVFIYYLVVTASTVGYGDYSPASELGKWVTSLFIIPVGLGLFAIVVGQVASLLVESWRKGIMGKRSLKMNDHILVLGWNEKRTLNMLDMLLHEEKNSRPIVLCACVEMENPLPGIIEFVSVSSYVDSVEMARAGISQASVIIIDTPEDDVTLSAALFVSGKNANAHILAYFNNEELSHLLKAHCPNVECIPSVSIEMLAKSAIDPGSSGLHQELLSTTTGMTQYSVVYPSGYPTTTFEILFHSFKKQHDAILIAVDNGDGLKINPNLSCEVAEGMTLFYISDERVVNINWPK